VKELEKKSKNKCKEDSVKPMHKECRNRTMTKRPGQKKKSTSSFGKNSLERLKENVKGKEKKHRKKVRPSPENEGKHSAAWGEKKPILGRRKGLK